ncbi:MAG: DUF4041 domain-containing protein [Isosphaeraceae bacterium]
MLVVVLGLLAAALFFFLKCGELTAQLRAAKEEWETKELEYTSELTRLDKIRHIPNVIERAKKAEADCEARIAESKHRADAIIERAMAEAHERSVALTSQAEKLKAEAQFVLKASKEESEGMLQQARKEAKELTSKANKDAREKKEKTEQTLLQAMNYSREIRHKADQRAQEIAGEAFQARGKLKDYELAVQALENKITRYEGIASAPEPNVLDELASDFGFHNSGVRLKLARERTRLMRERGEAATCGYAEGWKKDHAIKFVLSTFDGKVDSILSRAKPGNQAKLSREIKDAYALINKDGEVYKNARIEEDYLDARLEELKWAMAVMRIKEKAREEQRAIREQIREEARAKREIERALKQAEREEQLVNQAIAKLRKQFEEAGEAERARLETQLQELNVKLVEAEEKGKRALSMAQQTKQGNVYIISNLGSFGENVYKIGMTRRIDPSERVRELGDASVPFSFDIHAMLKSDDAPALETLLHRRFVDRQVNKLNKRKEFFRVDLREIKQAVDELGIDSEWTFEYAAAEYRETKALEEAMKTNAQLREKWLEDQANLDANVEAMEDAEQELEEADA